MRKVRFRCVFSVACFNLSEKEPEMFHLLRSSRTLIIIPNLIVRQTVYLDTDSDDVTMKIICVRQPLVRGDKFPTSPDLVSHRYF